LWCRDGRCSRDAGNKENDQLSTRESRPEETSAASEGDASGLEPFRRRLDQLDDQIARLLGERFDVCREVARFKSEHEIPMMQPDRVAQVRARYLARGAEVDLPPEFTASMFELMIAATCRLEDELMDGAS
jgi:4-amino-4-deoxychorismate mutase